MLSRPAAGALVALALLFASGEGPALAQPPPATSGAAAPSTAPPAQAPPKGAIAPPGVPDRPTAIVVAVSTEVGPATRALAAEVYRDPELRPSIDDATARVLAGEAPAEGAPPRLKELAELRASIVQALAAVAPPPAADAGAAPRPNDLVARRLLASLGAELGATLVVAVAMDGSRPIARVLRPATASFERVELGPTIDIAADGARTYRWPGATATLHGLVPGAAVAMGETPKPPAQPVTMGETPKPPAQPAPPAPLAPRAETAPEPPAPVEPRPFYKSPWFWGSVGGAAAIGLGVFLVSRVTSTTTNVHLAGKVGP